LVKHDATFDRLKATEEVIAELKQESDGWECGRRACERMLKRRLGDQAAAASVVCMPDDIRSLDNEFWQRVENAIREGLEGGEIVD
jgi:hypothetical protein